MYQIELNNKNPNQKFNVSTTKGVLEIELRTVDNITLMTISSGGNNIASSIRVAPNCLLIGYRHLQEQYGDFVFSTTDNEYPYYENFGQGNKLYWLTPDEVKQYKNETN